MQPMAYNVRVMCRWVAKTTDETVPGDCVREWTTDGTPHRLHITPLPTKLTRTETGFMAEESRLQVFNPDRTVRFQPGDRLGDAKAQTYEVLDVEDFQTHQSFHVRPVVVQDGDE